MECAGHVASQPPHVSVYECVESGKLRRLSGSSSSGIGLSASQVVSSIGDVASDLTGVSGLNSIGEDSTMML